MNGTYTVTIAERGGVELTKKMLAAIMTNLSSCADIGELTRDENSLVLNIGGYAVVAIHNERSKGEKDYDKLIIVTTDGRLFITGSPSCMETFRAIWDMMEGEDPETWGVEFFQMASQNFKGKSFITCKVV